MCIIICEIDRQSRFNAWDRVLRAGALGWPWGMGWGGRWERGSGWGTHVHPWLIRVNVWQKLLQYFKVISLLLKKKKDAVVLIKAVIYWDQIKPSQVHCFLGSNRNLYNHTNATGKLKHINSYNWITDTRVNWSTDY